MTRIVAPSRLHFGLFHVPSGNEPLASERAFGGVGLMIDSPGVVVTTEAAESWRFEGPHAARAQEFAMRYALAAPRAERKPLRVLVERCPVEHTGLGVGTQLGLAVAKSLAIAEGEPEADAVTLATRVGRGERSAIGVHGFERGGLIIEAGRAHGEPVSPLVGHVILPAAWRVVLFSPTSAGTWHGTRERAAFASALAGDADSLRKLAETVILPAAQAGDVNAFGDAVHEFNRRAGEPFAEQQGGPYASTEIAALIADLRKIGVHGVGQSSWGPTVFAVVADNDLAMALVLRFGRRVSVSVARVSPGARVALIDPTSSV